jgi:hypothetical protein
LPSTSSRFGDSGVASGSVLGGDSGGGGLDNAGDASRS